MHSDKRDSSGSACFHRIPIATGILRVGSVSYTHLDVYKRQLAHTGFFVEDMVETLPDEHALQECPGMIKELIKPSFLIVRARKMTREM